MRCAATDQALYPCISQWGQVLLRNKEYHLSSCTQCPERISRSLARPGTQASGAPIQPMCVAPTPNHWTRASPGHIFFTFHWPEQALWPPCGSKEQGGRSRVHLLPGMWHSGIAAPARVCPGCWPVSFLSVILCRSRNCEEVQEVLLRSLLSLDVGARRRDCVAG